MGLIKYLRALLPLSLFSLAVTNFNTGCEPDVTQVNLPKKTELSDLLQNNANSEDLSSNLDASTGFNRDAACLSIKAEAKQIKKSLDIILVVDNSGSMGDKIKAVQNNINANFGNILNNNQLDYRVIVLSKHGDVNLGSAHICITKPLSNTDCNPVPPKPSISNRFYHYDQEVDSRDSLLKLIQTYIKQDINGFSKNGWSDWLRKDAVKIIIEVSDDDSGINYSTFLNGIIDSVPQMFGTQDNPNLIFYSIVSLKENNPPTKPWTYADVIKLDMCQDPKATPVRPGIQYQLLSNLTKGLRFSICQYNSFDVVFKQLAAEVTTNSILPCEFEIPSPPAGKQIGDIAILYTIGMGPQLEFTQVKDEVFCDANKFYIDNVTNKIELCKKTCDRVLQEGGKIDIYFGCDGKIF
ncbi:hypothetical protein HYU23_00980 [Candidatus Woesearchaeota archaeon]|nr:hypothetical protein [Candidatus Woesearchaeota archaeon]